MGNLIICSSPGWGVQLWCSNETETFFQVRPAVYQPRWQGDSPRSVTLPFGNQTWLAGFLLTVYFENSPSYKPGISHRWIFPGKNKNFCRRTKHEDKYAAEMPGPGQYVPRCLWVTPGLNMGFLWACQLMVIFTEKIWENEVWNSTWNHGKMW